MDNTSAKNTDNISLVCDEDLSKNDDIDLSDSCKQNNNQSEIETSHDSNKSCSHDSDVKVLSEVNDEELRLEKEIEDKKLLLKWKREDLCKRLMSYKLMEFSTTPDISSIYSVPAKLSPPKSPEVSNQEGKHPNSKTPSSNATLGQIAANNQHAYLDEDAMVRMAIQASLEDLAAKSKATANLQSPPGTSASGLSDKSQTDSGNRNYPEAQQIPCSGRAGSSRSPKNPFIAVNPLGMWNVHQQDTSTNRNKEEEVIEIIEEEVLQEGFIEAEKYDGDKGKRPLSGKYSYKKRSKISQADSSGQPSGTDVYEKDLGAE